MVPYSEYRQLFTLFEYVCKVIAYLVLVYGLFFHEKDIPEYSSPTKDTVIQILEQKVIQHEKTIETRSENIIRDSIYIYAMADSVVFSQLADRLQDSD